MHVTHANPLGLILVLSSQILYDTLPVVYVFILYLFLKMVMKKLRRILIGIFFIVCHFYGLLQAEGFCAGTLVKTPGGYTPIEQLKLGDGVISYSLKEQATTVAKVVAISVTPVREYFEVDLPGEQLCVSPDHQFYTSVPVSDQACDVWKKIESFNAYDNLFSSTGCVPITEIKQIKCFDRTCVYTITVEPEHNFFVTRSDILVHNFVFVIPIATWVFGEGIKLVGLATLALILGRQVLVRTAEKVAKQRGIEFTIEGSPLPPNFDPRDPKDDKNKNTIEKVLGKVKSYEQARNKALELTGDLGPNSKPYVGRLGTGKGKIVGRQSADGKVRWRLDYDPNKGPHINVENFSNGKDINAIKVAIPFEGNMQTIESLLKHLNG